MVSHVEAERILRFLDSIIVKPDDFRTQVTLSLSDVFGYNKSIFWLVDDNSKKLCNPVYLNVKDNSINLYVSRFGELDFLNPYNLSISKIKTETVLNMPDIVSDDEFLQSTYYLEFLRRFNERHVMLSYLLEEDRVIGAVSVVRNKDENAFNYTDKQRLKIISRHLSRNLASILPFANLFRDEFEMSGLFECQVALIIFDSFLKVHRYNQAASDLCRELLSTNEQEMTPQEFLNIVLQGKFPSWRSGTKFRIMSPRCRTYTIHIIPEHQKTFFASEFYTLYLYENIEQSCSEKEYDIMTATDGRVKLTSKEREVVKLVMEGLTNQQIANKLVMSLPTVKTHLTNVFKKLNVPNRTSLCRKLGRIGIT